MKKTVTTGAISDLAESRPRTLSGRRRATWNTLTEFSHKPTARSSFQIGALVYIRIKNCRLNLKEISLNSLATRGPQCSIYAAGCSWQQPFVSPHPSLVLLKTFLAAQGGALGCISQFFLFVELCVSPKVKYWTFYLSADSFCLAVKTWLWANISFIFLLILFLGYRSCPFDVLVCVPCSKMYCFAFYCNYCFYQCQSLQFYNLFIFKAMSNWSASLNCSQTLHFNFHFQRYFLHIPI